MSDRMAPGDVLVLDFVRYGFQAYGQIFTVRVTRPQSHEIEKRVEAFQIETGSMGDVYRVKLVSEFLPHDDRLFLSRLFVDFPQPDEKGVFKPL